MLGGAQEERAPISKPLSQEGFLPSLQRPPSHALDPRDTAAQPLSENAVAPGCEERNERPRWPVRMFFFFPPLPKPDLGCSIAS